MNKPKLTYFDAPISRGEECRLALHDAARHEGMMQHVEDLRAAVTPTIRMEDAEKRTAREALVAGFLPAWARFAERNILGEPFFGGPKLHVVDLKLHIAVRWFIGGKVDHIPATIFAGYSKLTGGRRRARASRREILVREGLSAWGGLAALRGRAEGDSRCDVTRCKPHRAQSTSRTLVRRAKSARAGTSH